jgi:hypothetical protein
MLRDSRLRTRRRATTSDPEIWVQLGSNCCRIRYKTVYQETEQSQTNQLDRFLFCPERIKAEELTTLNTSAHARVVVRVGDLPNRLRSFLF